MTKDWVIKFQKQKYQYEDYIRYINNRVNIKNNVSRVVVKMQRSPKMLFEILWLLENKITFIIVDSNSPVERMEYIISDSKADLIIDDDKYTFLDIKSSKLDDVAYILYTSGTTGVPKGVQITRDSLFEFFDDIENAISFSSDETIACLTSTAFDIFLLESLFCFYKGGTILLADEQEKNNPRLICDLLKNNNVDIVQMTPSKLTMLSNYDSDFSFLEGVGKILVGGEKFPLGLLQSLQKNTNAIIYNLYGPTETTIWSSISDLTKKTKIDIGKSLQSEKIYILDDELNSVNVNEIGEICISGSGVAKGYLNNLELTNQKFVNLPSEKSIKIFRTGDLGKMNEDGNIEFLGRKDNQVKLHGYRIELEEIECFLNEYDGINQSVVSLQKNQFGTDILVAFYTSNKKIDERTLVQFLEKKLPYYMIPTQFVEIEKFKLNQNGKIDRSALREINDMQKSITDENNYDSIAKKICKIIYENTNGKVDSITREKTFNDIGIDSISFIKIVVSIENEFNFQFDDTMLMPSSYTALNDLVTYVAKKTIDK